MSTTTDKTDAIPEIIKAKVLGINIEIESARLTDVRFADIIAEIDKAGQDNWAAYRYMREAVKFLFPDYEQIYKKLEDKNGTLSVQRFSDFFQGIITLSVPKN